MENPGRAALPCAFSPADPLGTPNALNMEDSRVAQALQAGVMAISAGAITMNAWRGSYLYLENGGVHVPLYGGCGEIAILPLRAMRMGTE